MPKQTPSCYDLAVCIAVHYRPFQIYLSSLGFLHQALTKIHSGFTCLSYSKMNPFFTVIKIFLAGQDANLSIHAGEENRYWFMMRW